MSVTAAKRGLVSVGAEDALLVVAGEEVELGEKTSTAKTINQLVNTRERVSVLPGDPVETAVVDTHAKCAILLLYKQDWSAVG